MSNNPNDPMAAAQDAATPETKTTGPASQARVTSEELAQALALIEARKEAQAQHLAGTIPLGQAVEELELEVSPEELLAEVKALRQRTAPQTRSSLPTKPTPENTASTVSAPTEMGDPAPALSHCPACSRKLLTQASALCNWCGARIDDPKYQEQAARSRQQLDRSELTQLETMVQEETRYGIFGRLKRRAKGAGSKSPLG